MFSSQIGNLTILSIAVAMILILFTPFIIDVAILLKTRADAKSAADAASLAAAQEILARAVAEMNNTKLISYSVKNNETVVTVSKTANLIFIDNFIKNSIEIKATSSSETRFPWEEG